MVPYSRQLGSLFAHEKVRHFFLPPTENDHLCSDSWSRSFFLILVISEQTWDSQNLAKSKKMVMDMNKPKDKK